MFICALLAAGCSSGGGGDAFVASPGSGNVANGGGTATGSGSVTFNFVKAQAPITVPVSTVRLRFEFFTGLEGTGNIVKNEVRDFANTITIDGVPNNVRSSVVTAITADGFPVAEFIANINVAANVNTTVDGVAGTTVPVTPTTVTSSPQNISLGNGDTLQVSVAVTFSNGDTVVLDGAQAASFITFATDNAAVAGVAPDGTITAGVDGTANITGTFSLGGTPVNIVVTVGSGIQPPPAVVSIDLQTVEAQPVSLPVGTLSQPVTVVATLDNMTTQNVTQNDGVVFSSDNTSVTVNSSGQIVVAPGATAPDTAIITATFQGQVDTVQVNVADTVLQSLTANPASISLPFGGFEQSIAVFGNFSNNTTVQLIPGSSVLFSENDPNNLFTFAQNLVNNTVLVTTAANGTAGNATLTAQANGFSNNPSLPISITVGSITVNSLTVTPSQVLNMIPGQVQEFVVVANLSSGPPIDVSDFAALTVTAIQAPSSVDTDIVANDKQVVAVTSTPIGENAIARFALGGAQRDVAVTVITEQLESIVVRFGGNPVPVDNTVNLPRGYVGIVEVLGTFNTGGTRLLRANEYNLIAGAETLPTPGPGEVTEADSLTFLHGYTPQVLNAEYNNNAPRTGTSPGIGPNVDAWNNTTAISNDFLGFLRTVAVADAANPGSTPTTVRTRDTFKAIVADWRRGEVQGTTPVDATGANPVQAVDTQRFFTVDIDDNLIPPLDPNSLDNRVLSVTIIDPDLVTFVSADFVNYPNDNFVALNSVRELDIRVNFSATNPGATREAGDWPTQGRAVNAINNFRLAEANVDFTANGFRQVSTSIGWPSMTATVPIQDALVLVDVLPVAGFGGIPSNVVPPGYSDVEIPGPAVNGNGIGDNYVAGEYGISYDTFGPSLAPSANELPGIQNATDPGPANASGGFGQTFGQRAQVAPPDEYKQGTATGNGGQGVSVVQPILFSVDPIDAGGTVPLEIGAGQTFRTVILFDDDPEGLKDRSLDYPPTLFTGSPISFVSTLLDDNTGRVRVSAVANAANVTAGDVDAQSGNTILSTRAPIVTAIGEGVQGFVAAIDAVSEPIIAVGNFTPGNEDSLNQTGPAEAVTTLSVTP